MRHILLVSFPKSADKINMRKSFSILPLVFGIFSVTVLLIVFFLLGKTAISSGVIKLEDKVTKEQKLTSLEVAKNVIKNSTIYKEPYWHEIDLNHNEWDNEDTTLEIRYFPISNEDIRFFVIVHPKNKIGGILVSRTNKSMIIALGSAGDKLIAYPNGFSVGQRIISGFGIVHILSDDKDGFLTITPPITEAEIERNFILIEDAKASIEDFSIDLLNK